VERTGNEFTRWAGFANVVNLTLFQLVLVVAWLLRPGYSPISQPASDLGVGPNGSVVDAVVIVLALLKIALAVAFFIAMLPALSRGWRWVGAVLIAVPGLGNIATAIFTEAPSIVALEPVWRAEGAQSIGRGNGNCVQHSPERLRDYLEPAQVLDEGEKVGGIGTLAATSAQQALGFADIQESIQQAVRGCVCDQPVAELA
jgi:uncharacterized protein DUF998